MQLSPQAPAVSPIAAGSELASRATLKCMDGFPEQTPVTPLPWTAINAADADIRLIACDMDGTLLTADGRVPDALWPLLERLSKLGVSFVPASGRQYATLAGMFTDSSTPLSFIAENGNLVMHQGQVISSSSLDMAVVQQVTSTIRASDRKLGLVVCGLESAYVERRDDVFIAEARKYYARLEIVNDLMATDDSVLKLAIFDFDDAAIAARTTLQDFAENQQVVVSGRNWVDIMTKGVDKGKAVVALQHALGVTPGQTAAFGDYLNDLEMLGAAEWSFAMDNAHADIRAAARYLAPGHEEQGVIQVLEHLFM